MSNEKNYIEEKKSQSANLETKKTTWLLLGYIVVLAVTFAAGQLTRKNTQEKLSRKVS